MEPSWRTFVLHAHVALGLNNGKVDFAQGGFWEQGAYGTGVTAGLLKADKYKKLRQLTAKLVDRHYHDLLKKTGGLRKAKPAKVVPAAAAPVHKSGMPEWEF